MEYLKFLIVAVLKSYQGNFGLNLTPNNIMSKNKATAPKAKQSNKENNTNVDFLDRFDRFVSGREKFWLIFFTVLTALFSFLLFDIKLSTGGDDSSYIIRAYNFYHKGMFPTFQGPLYPILISYPIGWWGINVPLLKSFSVLFMVAHVFLFFYTLRNRLPSVVVFFSTLLIAVNAGLLYYASQTYTEAIYFFTQSLMLFIFFKLYDSQERGEGLKENYKLWLILGLMVCVNVLTKNAGMGAVLALLGYFVLRLQFKNAGIFVASFGLFYGTFELLKKALWSFGEAQISSQGSVFLLKDPYDAKKGVEDFGGYVTRFLDNCQIYLSKHLMHIWGLKPIDDITLSGGVAFLISVLLFIGLFLGWKKSKPAFFLSVYTLVNLAVIFIVLQTRWDSERLMLVAVPYIAPVVLYVFYRLFKAGGISMLQPLFILLLVVLSLVQLGKTISASSKNFKVLKKNMSGDKYYGYTDDWRNLFLMSEWCAKNLPKESYVMSRKGPMSFIYSNGKPFYEVYRVPSDNADTLISILEKNKVTHVIHASLRANPLMNTGRIITTTNNYLAIIAQKYPNRIKLVHQIGDSEPAYLYEITKK